MSASRQTEPVAKSDTLKEPLVTMDYDDYLDLVRRAETYDRAVELRAMLDDIIRAGGGDAA